MLLSGAPVDAAPQKPATTVIRIEKRGSCVLFEPKRAVVRHGDHVVWVNQTGEDVTLRFTGGSPFRAHRPLAIAEGGIGGGVIAAQPLPGQKSAHGYASFPATCPEIRTDPGQTPGPSVVVEGAPAARRR